MPKLYNNFTEGVMNKDTELRLLPKGMMIDAKNVRIVSNESNNNRSVKPVKAATKRSFSVLTNAVTLGTVFDGAGNEIYWAVRDDNGSYIYRYNPELNDVDNVVLDTRGGSAVIDFTGSTHVDMQVLNDADNGKTFLFLTDGVHEPLCFEVDGLSNNSTFTEQEVLLIKRPPTTSPSISLDNTLDDVENHIETRFYSFAYRYRYTNGEYSALSPFSDFAFLPKTFAYNYREGTNTSMFNTYSEVDITLDVGTGLVTDVELVAKQSGSSTAYIVETYNKSEQGWTTGTEVVTFSTSKFKKILDPNQLNRLYDNVPVKAAALEIIGNRLVFGNYTENYDLTYSGSPIETSLTLSYQTASGTEGNAHTTVKSNRDYEIAIAYLDGKGRMTTPITSIGNSVYVKNQDADTKNTLRVTIGQDSRPPDWATHYRFFVKQNAQDYDTISPIKFYNDGLDSWLKLEGDNIQKVSQGQFLYVKSDTAGLRTAVTRTKVLEVTEKERNFLETNDTIKNGEDTLQQAGVYMRVNSTNFALSEDAITEIEYSGVVRRTSGKSNNNFNAHLTYVEPIVFYGEGLNDCSVTSGNTFTDVEDIRYEIEITNASSTPNKVTITETVVSDNTKSQVFSETNILSGNMTVGTFGLTIAFGATTGHTLNDRWVVNCKSTSRSQEWNWSDVGFGFGRRAVMLFRGKDPLDGGEQIKAGSEITIVYDDTASYGAAATVGKVTNSFIAQADYANIEEWFWEEDILSSSGLTYPDSDEEDYVMFRRGTEFTASEGGKTLTVTGDSDDPMWLLITSPGNFVGGSSGVIVETTLNIVELDNFIIFETIPEDGNIDVFYELPQTFAITSGNHQGNTQNQIFGLDTAICDLTWYNAFGWYNGYESIKIGDAFNSNTMILDTRSSVPLDEYKQVTRIASLTYSDVYEGTTQFNGINEFNLSETNFKDMDSRYGVILKLYSEDTDLEVYQDDKVHKVLFNKSIIYNADGTGNVSASNRVLGQEIAYTGDYGISGHPESWAAFGNRRYFYDRQRGVLLRLSVDGLTEISKRGMHDYFRTLTDQSSFVGGYDPYNDEYLINVGSDLTLAFSERATEGGGFTGFFEYTPERLIGANNRLYGFSNGNIHLHDDHATIINTYYGSAKSSSIRTVINDSSIDQKIFKSMNLETDSSLWSVSFTTPLGTGTILPAEWELNEGEYYAHMRQEETALNYSSIHSIIGIGEFVSIDTSVLTVDTTSIPNGVAIGDLLYHNNTPSPELVGTISAIGTSTITVSSVTNTPTAGDLLFAVKNSRVSGEPVKGSFLDITLTNAATTTWEMYALKVEASKSYD